jgi:Helix-turn-helix domain
MIPKRLLRPLPPPLETILNPSPTAPELAAAHAAGHTLTAIANHLNLHKSTISRRLARGFTSDQANQPQPGATSET